MSGSIDNSQLANATSDIPFEKSNLTGVTELSLVYVASGEEYGR
jgi:hypothetical protein